MASSLIDDRASTTDAVAGEGDRALLDRFLNDRDEAAVELASRAREAAASAPASSPAVPPAGARGRRLIRLIPLLILAAAFFAYVWEGRTFARVHELAASLGLVEAPRGCH